MVGWRVLARRLPRVLKAANIAEISRTRCEGLASAHGQCHCHCWESDDGDSGSEDQGPLRSAVSEGEVPNMDSRGDAKGDSPNMDSDDEQQREAQRLEFMHDLDVLRIRMTANQRRMSGSSVICLARHEQSGLITSLLANSSWLWGCGVELLPCP